MDRTPTTDELNYDVAGISCAHCQVAIADEVAQVPGVAAIDVDLATKRVTVSGAGLSDDAVRAAIAEAGYEAAP